MRPSVVLGVLVGSIVVLSALPGLLGPAARGAAPPAAVETSVRSGPVASPVAPALPPALAFRNVSYANPRPASGGPPVSAIPETPAPAVPDTTPVIVHFPQWENSTPVTELFTAPTGTWGAIVFSYTGTVVGDVYDSSYRAYVDENQFLEGTTPEYGTWTVTQDLIEYQSLFHGEVNVTFLLGAAIIDGHFITNLSLAFYPVAPGTAPPRTPDAIVPIFGWNHTYLSQAGGWLWANATVPDNVTNATLQLFVYGFGATDEFWYSDGSGSTYRAAYVTVGGRTIATVLPFPYVNTGGIDLFLWRPLTGGMTIADRPYEIDVSGAIGLLEGTHEYGGNLSGGLGSGNTWLIGGSLLLYTAANASAARSTEYRAEGGGASYSHTTSTSDTASTFALEDASVYALGNRTVNESTDLSDAFTNDQLLASTSSSQTQNISMSEQLATTTWSNSSLGTEVSQRTYDFPFVLDDYDEGTVVSQTSTTETIDFNQSITAWHQEWEESDVSGPQANLSGGGSAVLGTSASVDDLTTASGSYGGVEVANKEGGGATIQSISGILSQVAKSFQYDLAGGDPSNSYLHQLSDAAENPPGPYNAATLLSDRIVDPLVVAASASPVALDAGQHLTLTARALGGIGGYSYAWTGLPPGCPSENATTLLCTPTGSGAYDPMVLVRDANGSTASASTAPLLIAPPLAVTVVANASAWDAGQPIGLEASVSGGTGTDLLCHWFVNNTSAGPAVPCDTTFVSGGPGTGEWSFSVTVTDSSGSSASSQLLTLSPALPPSATVFSVLPTSSSLYRAGLLEFNASVVGGSAPYLYLWEVNGVNGSLFGGPSLDVSETTPTNVTVVVWVTDAAGETVGSQPVTTASGPVASSPRSASTSSGSSTDETGWYVAAAAIAAAAVLALLLLIPRRPGPAPRPAPRAPAPMPPAPPGGRR